MDKSNFQYFWPKIFCLCLINIIYVQGIFIKFTNITCDSIDNKATSVDYCLLRHVNRVNNYVSVRYMLLKPIEKDYMFNFRFMKRNHGWQPFLYAVNIDVCRFWKTRYNAIAKLFLGITAGHSNMNHSCPFEKYLTFDKIMNTDVSRNLRGIPLGKGHYAVFTTWSQKNNTRARVNVYIEVVAD